MAPIKIGIIGYGFSAKCFHIPFILPNPDLKVHAFLQRAAAPKDKAAVSGWGHCTVDFPEVKHYRTADDFFADPDIDLVIICTHAHEEFIERALTTGKHVVVEKPFTTTSAAADKLIALAKEKGKLLTVFQNRRWDSGFRTLHHLVRQGALGDIKEAELHYDIPSPTWISGWSQKEYSPGQGMLFGLGSHTIDQALLLFGKPRSVTAFLRSNRGVASDVDDTFTIILQYSGAQRDLLVTIKTGIITPLKDQLNCFVRGTKGSYVKFGTDPQEAKAIAAPGQPATATDYGQEDESIWGTLTTMKEFDSEHQTLDSSSKLYVGRYPSLPGWYRGYYENIVEAVRGNAEVDVNPVAARDGIRVIELARESHAKGATVLFS
ncbi:Scyllo-inositol 2-dehydrogenase (NADP(+)) [Coniochaeta hoffmannii]|uniref:Scyllo-inositol 2-dehydrogenase (NADP(+)) n=1 Tax=Coniochaeta hoffmannii TaxID=91930 RepID=A0AA38RIZ9_9PEZI|nr:Scyllo-inositol 2-dehydrogenase (NADP(+)) [Coniochaeta hoffmannii]